MVAFARCEQESGEIMEARLRDDAFRRRMERTSSRWQIEHGSFLRQVKAVIAVALFSAYRESVSTTSAQAARDALAILRGGDAVQLFAGLPDDLSDSSTIIESLRLMSFGLTPNTPLKWARLAQAAENVLNPNAVFPGPTEMVVEKTDGPTRTIGIVTARKSPPDQHA